MNELGHYAVLDIRNRDTEHGVVIAAYRSYSWALHFARKIPRAMVRKVLPQHAQGIYVGLTVRRNETHCWPETAKTKPTAGRRGPTP